MTRFELTFAALLLVQALHSVEEYFGRLWIVFPPAAFIAGLISDDHRLGFIVFNLILLAFGVWCFFWPIRGGRPAPGGFVAFWVAIELINGIGHPLWTLQQRAYTPGVITAPALLLLAISLGWQYATRDAVASRHKS